MAKGAVKSAKGTTSRGRGRGRKATTSRLEQPDSASDNDDQPPSPQQMPVTRSTARSIPRPNPKKRPIPDDPEEDAPPVQTERPPKTTKKNIELPVDTITRFAPPFTNDKHALNRPSVYSHPGLATSHTFTPTQSLVYTNPSSHSIPPHCIPPHPIPSHSIPPNSIPPTQQPNDRWTYTSHWSPTDSISPSYPTSSYLAPSHPAPLYASPSYSVLSRPASSHPAPSHPAPSHPAPSHSAPSHSVPSHPAPSHSAPSHSVPSHSAPSHAAPSRSLMSPGPAADRAQPPPYQPPHQPPRPSTVISIGSEGSSDGEEAELDPTEDGEDDPSLVEFLRPREVLQDYWRRNGPPSGRPPSDSSSRAKSTYRTRTVEPVPVASSSTQLSSIQPTPTHAVPRQRAPTQSLPGGRDLKVAQRAPAQPATPSSAPVLAPPEGAVSTASQGDYPKEWQDLIAHASHYILRDMMFSHPFPAGTDGQLWSREAVSSAAASYPSVHDMELPSHSFDAHRHRIAYLALRAARGLRGKFRTSIKEIIYDTKEIGISPKTSALSVSNRAEMLVFGNRYLDAPYSNHVLGRPVEGMYGSQVLKRAVQLLYLVHPWSTAMGLSRPRGHSEHLVFPPTAFVAFAACAFKNVLDNFVHDGDDSTVPFSDLSYSAKYDELYQQIEDDLNDPVTGDVIRRTLQSFIPGSL